MKVLAALQHGAEKERVLESPEERHEEEEEEGVEDTSSGEPATADITAADNTAGQSDAGLVSSHVTPPLSASAQGRSDSKLSSITEAEEQESHQ